MNVLLILNDAPYRSARSYNALRLAMALQKEQTPETLRVFLLVAGAGPWSLDALLARRRWTPPEPSPPAPSP